MSWPLSHDFNEAIQNPKLVFSDPDLKAGEAVVGAGSAAAAVRELRRRLPDPRGRWPRLGREMLHAPGRWAGGTLCEGE